MSEIKLHLGCGEKYIPGYVHIDIVSYPHIDYQQSIMFLPQFDDNTVDYIYCCHAFEYLDREEGIVALLDWYRVLKPGGTIRLAVPDFDAIIENYQKWAKKDIESQGILGPLYGKIDAGYMCIYHKTVYNFESLKKMMEKVGFKDIKIYNWKKTEHSDIDDFSQAYIPHMDKENGLLISLNVEGKK